MGFARLRLAAAGVVVFVLAVLAGLPHFAQALVGDVTLISSGADAAPSNGDSGPRPVAQVLCERSLRRIRVEGHEPRRRRAAGRHQHLPARPQDRHDDARVPCRRRGRRRRGRRLGCSVDLAGRTLRRLRVHANNLSPDDDDAFRNVFVRDTAANTTTLVSRAADGSAALGDSAHPSISSNGAFVAFGSTADNLSTDDNDNFSNVYVRNMETGAVKVGSRLVAGSLSVPRGRQLLRSDDRPGRTAHRLHVGGGQPQREGQQRVHERLRVRPPDVRLGRQPPIGRVSQPDTVRR